MSSQTATLLALLVCLTVAGRGTSVSQNIRGTTAGDEQRSGEQGGVIHSGTHGGELLQQQQQQEEEEEGEEWWWHEELEEELEEEQRHSRILRGGLASYEIKGEEEYSSCPQSYPSFGKLGDLLTAWSPNQPEVPEGGVVERLRVLNYSDPEQLVEAKKLRDCELPFKLIGLPEADAASAKWTDEYLDHEMKDCSTCNVMRSDSNRFMFWHMKSGVTDKKWKPPTSPEAMTYRTWRNWADEADADKIGPEDVHYYLTTGVPASIKTPPMSGKFVADDLPFFSTRSENFIISDVAHQKGIQCRFGARGIIAESHFDHGKNFVLMLRGRKRYLLNPPRACPVLEIIPDRKHPSFRHSDVDWSDESDWPEGFADAPGLETVLEAGELLYIPSYWYHYIVSEGFNVQCNARSGLSLRKQWQVETDSCLGMSSPSDGGNTVGHKAPRDVPSFAGMDGRWPKDKGMWPRSRSHRNGEDRGAEAERRYGKRMRHGKSTRHGRERSGGRKKRRPDADMMSEDQEN